MAHSYALSTCLWRRSNDGLRAVLADSGFRIAAVHLIFFDWKFQAPETATTGSAKRVTDTCPGPAGQAYYRPISKRPAALAKIELLAVRVALRYCETFAAFGDLSRQREAPGNRLSAMITPRELSPKSPSTLIALHAHKTFVQSAMWDINSFAHFAEEFGRHLATAIVTEFAGNAANTMYDRSTAALTGCDRKPGDMTRRGRSADPAADWSDAYAVSLKTTAPQNGL